ncbi:DNA polymerase I [Salmonella enterica subsp. enterica serovar Enteritidis]|nr:DNA polymerase I [Salmonella enterica subsp. enterica serovar Enteritidis]
MQVHDELVFEVHKDDLDAVAKRIHQLMENCTRIDVPLLGGSRVAEKIGIKRTKHLRNNALFS